MEFLFFLKSCLTLSCHVFAAKPAPQPQTPTGAQPFYAGQDPNQGIQPGVPTGAVVAPTNRLYKKDEGNPNAINLTAVPGGQGPGAEGPIGPQAGAGAAAEQSVRRKGKKGGQDLPMPVDFAPTGRH